jgi:hypothetical protein
MPSHSNEVHTPAVLFATVADDTYTVDRASLYIIDKIGGDRKKVAPLLPLLMGLARERGKQTLSQQQVDDVVNLLKIYPKLGVAATFAATDATQADVDRYLSMTPLGEAALKLRKESTNGKQ